MILFYEPHFRNSASRDLIFLLFSVCIIDFYILLKYTGKVTKRLRIRSKQVCRTVLFHVTMQVFRLLPA